MTRTLTYHLSNTSLEIPLTVKGFLKSKDYSTQNLKIIKQLPDGILLNGAPAHMNARLNSGDILTVQIKEEVSSENIVPVKLPLNIVYEDEDLLVVNKPAGMPIHPSQNNYDNTLANALAYYFQQKGVSFVFRCIGRLDRDTSGLTVIAKHFVSAGILGDLVAAKTQQTRCQSSTPKDPWSPLPQSFTREYHAIVRGTVTPSSGTITAPLGRKPGSIIERWVDYENGEPAVTHYRVLEEKNGYSLVSLILGTGRTHQIRIHMKYIGYPLVGDYLYNPSEEASSLSRQALHSHRLSFPHPMTGEPLEFVAPLPDDMQNLLI
ncbi:MAG: RluA family pseudouridine synthase [Lachnospiraceae bacterium]|jgi:23S rRNA pseudouridine1911/1915/1917 synthase|nr:RluA family pseudouridine synthase [Lachnospiraceae bacterium]MBR4605000.1 RluA family pseudouridine synthase [Lachnospiraceae bacterium]MBR6150522.1 RluA family pseudouridine synthase [Lachnospiraceae bacterium]